MPGSLWDMSPAQLERAGFGSKPEVPVVVEQAVPRYKGARFVGYVGDGLTDPVEPVSEDSGETATVEAVETAGAPPEPAPKATRRDRRAARD